MSVETSKRKFDRILDAISDEVGKDHSIARKKIRLADVSIDRATIAKLWQIKLSSKATLTPIKAKSSTYNPVDKAEFRRRLLTFRSNISAWPPKPAEITEVKWALRGWELVDKNTVECKRCLKRILIDLEASDTISEETEQDTSDRQQEVEVNLVSKYHALIVDGHLEGCLWHERGCDKSIYRVDLNGFRNAIETFKSRFTSLTKVRDSMPNAVEAEDAMDVPALYNTFRRIAFHAERLAQSRESQEAVSLEDPDKTCTDTAAFTLALFGWERDPSNKNDKDVVIRCEACFARVGLWMYEHGDEAFSGGGLLPTLFAADCHYYDCPWIAGGIQDTLLTSPADKEIPAWKTLAKYLNWNQKSPRPQEQREATPVPLVTDRAARDASDKARLQRIRELTRSFGFKKNKAVG